MNRNKIQKDPPSSDEISQNAPAAGSSSAAAASSSSGPPSTSERPKGVLRRPVPNLRLPSVRIRRQPSYTSATQTDLPPVGGLHDIPEEPSNRRRSSSEPQRPAWYSSPDAADRLARSTTVTHMPPVAEEPGRPRVLAPGQLADQLAPHLAAHVAPHGAADGAEHIAAHVGPHAEGYLFTPEQNPGMLRRASVAARGALNWRPSSRATQSDGASIQVQNGHGEYDTEMVDLLDVIDPEISTLSTLTNVQNSLFIPNLGPLLNRRPTYNLTRRATNTTLERPPTRPVTADAEEEGEEEGVERPPLTHTSTISSTLSESRYAVLPHGESLRGWTPEEKEELNDLVRHMLHSKRAGFKRGLKGFGQYVRRPLGFFVTLYAFLITMFGLAWVLFLIGWISVGSKKDYLVNVVDNVLVALFAIMGDGLAPFRAVDTYHMIFIAHYHHLTWKLRKKANLPKLEDHNDLPTKLVDEVDVEDIAADTGSTDGGAPWEVSVLSPEQQRKLQHHQTKFSNSHTFYKPHETETHHAFPLRLLVAIVVLLDCHSLFQIALGACTWGINYKVRPFALTTVILCCSITCNITGGVLISVGDHRTRKKDVIEKMFRQELTSDAMRKVEKKRMKDAEKSGNVSGADTPNPMESRGPGSFRHEMEKQQEKEEIKREWKSIPKIPLKAFRKVSAQKGESDKSPV